MTINQRIEILNKLAEISEVANELREVIKESSIEVISKTDATDLIADLATSLKAVKQYTVPEA